MSKLESYGALPKSSSGRRAKPLDTEFATALVTAVKKTPVVEGRPATYGSSDRFDTRGKASSDGRRYADHVKEALELEKVSVAIDQHGKEFGWKLYVPMVAPVTEEVPSA